jgi:hypothetical protein
MHGLCLAQVLNCTFVLRTAGIFSNQVPNLAIGSRQIVPLILGNRSLQPFLETLK